MAKGVIIVPNMGSQITIHGVILDDSVARVWLIDVLQEEVEIPIPFGNIRYVGDARDTFLPWPKKLIVTCQV